MSGEPPAPKISDDLLEMFASGVTLYIATRDAALMPESMVGMGIRVHQDRRTVTLYLPKVNAAATLANLADNGQIAATLTCPPTHRSVQLKGSASGAPREGTASDREIQEIFRGALVEAFAAVGIPRTLTRGLAWWPCVAVDFVLSGVFTQTPGPNAGARISS
ncbi:MAG TPA: hypothetical protein VM686_31710 [Polyangiaceae bacterium]|jgi:hypothetical protein|nr:hypothetical protein [Polyangiaceae bacterium]